MMTVFAHHVLPIATNVQVQPIAALAKLIINGYQTNKAVLRVMDAMLQLNILVMLLEPAINVEEIR